MKLSRRHFLLTTSFAGLLSCSGGGTTSETLRIGIGSAPDSFDPAQGQFASAALLYKQLYTPLTNYGFDGGLAPGLAEGWQISDDGLRWTFNLRPDLQWSDGMPITADDVVFSVRRTLDPSSTYADAGDFFLLQNAPAVLAGELPLDQLGVRAFSAGQVEFTFSQPLGVFAELMREFYPAPAHILSNPDSKWPLPPEFVGSGPYLLQSANQQDISLIRNPLAPDPASIAEIYASVVEDAATRARLVRSGDLDLAEDPPANQLQTLTKQSGVKLYGWDAPRFIYLKINHQHPHLADPHVRQALNLAVDRAFIAEDLYLDTAKASDGILPWEMSKAHSYDEKIAQARKLMQQAGLQDGITLNLLHSGGFRERIAVILAENWKQIGVTCHLQAADGQGLYAFIDAGEFDLAMASFDRGLKRENWRLIEPFASDGFAANFNWTSAKYDRAVAAARSEANPVQRDWYAAEAADIIRDEAAIIPLVFERKYWLANPGLSGFSKKATPDQWRFLRRN
jgi:oligopeptide transport system substrate-binding protein